MVRSSKAPFNHKYLLKSTSASHSSSPPHIHANDGRDAALRVQRRLVAGMLCWWKVPVIGFIALCKLSKLKLLLKLKSCWTNKHLSLVASHPCSSWTVITRRRHHHLRRRAWQHQPQPQPGNISAIHRLTATEKHTLCTYFMVLFVSSSFHRHENNLSRMSGHTNAGEKEEKRSRCRCKMTQN